MKSLQQFEGNKPAGALRDNWSGDLNTAGQIDILVWRKDWQDYYRHRTLFEIEKSKRKNRPLLVDESPVLSAVLRVRIRFKALALDLSQGLRTWTVPTSHSNRLGRCHRVRKVMALKGLMVSIS